MGGYHDHSHPAGGRGRPSQRRLLAALALTASFSAIEVAGGWLSGSLALLSDAGHMLADAFALILSLFAVRFASLPATPEKSYGFYRLEILSALANGILLGLVSIYIFTEAWQRLFTPRPIESTMMLVVGGIGLLANLAAAAILQGASDNLNMRGAYLHVLADTLSSVGVLVGGVVIAVTGDTRIDPLISILIASLILWSAQRLVREAVDVLLEAIPKGIKMLDVNQTILETEGVVGVHDLHVWSLTTGVEALSVHVLVRRRDLPETDRILESINRALLSAYGIEHTTIQIESDNTISHVGTTYDCRQVSENDDAIIGSS